MIHGDDAAAGGAAAEEGFVILVQSEVPQHDALRPVARCANHQPHLLRQDFSRLPVAAGALGHPDVFVRKAIVQFVLGGDISSVTVRRSSRGKGRGLRIAQHFQRIFDQVPVVIEDQDFCFQLRLAERRTEIIRQDFGLLAGRHNHAGIIIRDVLRLVLHGNGENGDARCFVLLHELDEIFGERRIRRRQQRALNHGAGSFHPARRAPRRGEDFEIGIERKRFAEKRQDVRAIVLDGKTL